MKKVIYFVLILVLASAIGIGCYRWHISQPEENYDDMWKTKRKLPDNLALNAYLAGNAAKKEHRIFLALEAYEKVLKKDPENKNLLKDFYVLSMFQGTPQLILPYLKNIPDSLHSALLKDYLEAAQLFDEDPDKLLTFLQKKKKRSTDPVVLPLIRAWHAAKMNDKEAAINSLKSLKDSKTAYLLGYEEFLLGSYFNDDKLQETGLKKIQERKLPALGFFPLLKRYAQKDKAWNEALLFQQLKKMEKLYPATAELIQTYGESEITPKSGLAESFYFLSCEGMNGLFSKEEAVFLNSIALLLHPDKNLSLIWGAELTQAFDLPYMSVAYYQKIPQKTATLSFKEAAVLLLDNQNQKADKIMQELYKSNPNHVPLLTMMGQNYLTTRQNKKALDIYNRLIPLLEQNPQNKPLAEAYIARANLYQQENQEEQMISDLQKAQILMPDNPSLENNIAYNYLEADRIEEGFTLIQKAYQEDPTDPYILDSLAFAYYKLNQPQTALPFAEKALNSLPQSALINMHVGDIYRANGRLREAGFQYKKALDLKEDLTPELEAQIRQKIEQLSN